MGQVEQPSCPLNVLNFHSLKKHNEINQHMLFSPGDFQGSRPLLDICLVFAGGLSKWTVFWDKLSHEKSGDLSKRRRSIPSGADRMIFWAPDTLAPRLRWDLPEKGYQVDYAHQGSALDEATRSDAQRRAATRGGFIKSSVIHGTAAGVCMGRPGGWTQINGGGGLHGTARWLTADKKWRRGFAWDGQVVDRR